MGKKSGRIDGLLNKYWEENYYLQNTFIIKMAIPWIMTLII